MVVLNKLWQVYARDRQLGFIPAFRKEPTMIPKTRGGDHQDILEVGRFNFHVGIHFNSCKGLDDPKHMLEF